MQVRYKKRKSLSIGWLTASVPVALSTLYLFIYNNCLTVVYLEWRAII